VLSLDETDESIRDKVMEAVRAHFKPEFLNRVDEVIVFHRLRREDLARIVEIQLGRLRERLQERGIELIVSEEAKDYLATKGFDPSYGARPLKRLIQKEIENELALRLLDGTFKDGERIEVRTEGDGLSFVQALPSSVPGSG
jgi:ATP-dependent Clp protease ATP-binding subunit ClpB